MRIPDEIQRLFPSCSAADCSLPANTAFLIGRLLEEGDRRDLAWLVERVPEAELARWVERRGARQLSRRSLAFWSRLLGTSAIDPSDDSLWPL